MKAVFGMNVPSVKPSMDEPAESEAAPALQLEDSRDCQVHGARSRVSFAIHLGATAFLAIRLVPVWNRFGYIVRYETDWHESPRTGIAMLIAIGSWLVAVDSCRRSSTRQNYGVIERLCLGLTLVFMLVVLFYFCEFLMFWQIGPSS